MISQSPIESYPLGSIERYRAFSPSRFFQGIGHGTNKELKDRVHELPDSEVRDILLENAKRLLDICRRCRGATGDVISLSAYFGKYGVFTYDEVGTNQGELDEFLDGMRNCGPV